MTHAGVVRVEVEVTAGLEAKIVELVERVFGVYHRWSIQSRAIYGRRAGMFSFARVAAWGARVVGDLSIAQGHCHDPLQRRMFPVLHLDPVLRRASLIWPVPAIRYQAFEPLAIASTPLISVNYPNRALWQFGYVGGGVAQGV